MNTRKIVFWCGLMLAALIISWAPVAPVALLSGCATTKAEAVVYFTIKDSWILTKSAYTQWSERVVLGKVSQEKSDRIDADWNHYRMVMQSAITLSRKDWSAPASDNLIVVQNELIKLITEFSR